MLETLDLKATMRFWVDVLGFTVTGTWGHDPDNPTWCNVTRDDVDVMFTTMHTHDNEEEDGDGHDASHPHPAEHQPAMTGSIYLYADDVDAYAEAVKSAGGTLAFGPQDFMHGMREIGIADPNGYFVMVGQGVDAPAQ
jgi:predicted enzyme related to lactoylglutathione lyase